MPTNQSLIDASAQLDSLPISIPQNSLYPDFTHFNPYKLPTDFRDVPGKGYAEYTKKCQTSSLDKRVHKIIRLPNGIEAWCISDPQADTSAAAMTICAGTNNDPKHLPGLAHFVEHVISMGSKKYPDELHYDNFMHEHGGYSNAATMDDTTEYHFTVDPNSFSQALDIFAQFFISPLFNQSSLEREIKAVDNEYKGFLSNDSVRAEQILRSFLHPDHPSNAFSFGNLETLWNGPLKEGIDIRKELISFHEEYYTSSSMKLGIVHNEPIDVIEKAVVECFGMVPLKHKPFNYFDQPLFLPNARQKIIHYQSIEDIKTMEVIFTVPNPIFYFAYMSTGFISHFLNLEEKGSLSSYLKFEKYALEVSASTFDMGNSLEAGFAINVNLTDEGFENYTTVLEAIFAYLNLLKSASTLEILFKEVVSMQEIEFKYMPISEPLSEAQSVSTILMTPLPRNHLLSAGITEAIYDQDIIRKTLDYLDPDNFSINLCSNQIPDDEDIKQEKWFKSNYTVTPLDKKLLTKLKSPVNIDKLYLPSPNVFIPETFDIFTEDEVLEKAKVPTIIRQNSSTRVWYKKDNKWEMPKTNIKILIENPATKNNVLAETKTILLVQLLNDYLDEHLWTAAIAGSEFTVTISRLGVSLYISGYSDKAKVFLETILDKITNFKITPKIFELIKADIKKSFENYVKFIQPKTQSEWALDYLMEKFMYPAEKNLAIIDDITADDIQNWMKELFSHVFLEILFHGNILKEEALKLTDIIQTSFNATPLSDLEKSYSKIILPPPGKNIVIPLKACDSSETNSAVSYFCYVGGYNDLQLYARLTLLDQILAQNTFNVLRTNEQLGYKVSSETFYAGEYGGFKITVQGEKSASFLEGRVHTYVEAMANYLENMTNDEFESHRTAVILNLNIEPKNLFEESERYWGRISSKSYDFNRVENSVNTINEIAKEDSQRLDPESFEELLSIISNRNVDISFDLHKLIETRPTFDDIKKAFSEDVFIEMALDSAIKDEILSAIDGLIKMNVREEDEIINTVQQAREMGTEAHPEKIVGDFDLHTVM